MVNCTFSDKSHSSIVLKILLYSRLIGPQQNPVPVIGGRGPIVRLS